MPETPQFNQEEFAHEKGDFSDVHNEGFQQELREAGQENDPKSFSSQIKTKVFDSLRKVIIGRYKEDDPCYSKIIEEFNRISAEDFKPRDPDRSSSFIIYDKGLRIRGPLQDLEELVEAKPQVVEGCEKETEKLPPDELKDQLKIRYKLIQIFDQLTKFEPGYNSEFLKMDIDWEQEKTIQFGAYLLAPGAKTADFFKLFEIFQDPKKLLTTKDKARDELKKFIKFFWEENAGWKDKSVLEFGGSATAIKLNDLGAKCDVIDAGHSGYTAGYHISDPKAMINIDNYQEKTQLGVYDMICSANTLDWESGIEGMADKPTWTQGDHMGSKSTLMSMDELALIFCGLLKDKGYMVHDEMGLQDDLCDLIGIKKVDRINLTDQLEDKGLTGSTWSDERLHFYQKIGNTQIRTVVIGNKIAKFNTENNAWEHTGHRKREGRGTVLTTQEFIFCANRDIVYGGDLVRGEYVGHESLTSDGFKIQCKADDIEKLLKFIKLGKLLSSLSEKSVGDIEIWKVIISKANDDRDREYLIQRAPEEIRGQL